MDSADSEEEVFDWQPHEHAWCGTNVLVIGGVAAFVTRTDRANTCSGVNPMRIQPGEAEDPDHLRTLIGRMASGM